MRSMIYAGLAGLVALVSTCWLFPEVPADVHSWFAVCFGLCTWCVLSDRAESQAADRAREQRDAQSLAQRHHEAMGQWR